MRLKQWMRANPVGESGRKNNRTKTNDVMVDSCRRVRGIRGAVGGKAVALEPGVENHRAGSLELLGTDSHRAAHDARETGRGNHQSH